MADQPQPTIRKHVIEINPRDPTGKVKVHVDEPHKKIYVSEIPKKEKSTLGQKAADVITEFGGSWLFIGIFVLYMIVWIALNLTAILGQWDPYPFIMLNLTLSCLAALQAPIILMSQNRAAERDRKKAKQDFQIDKKAEMEIQDMQKDLEEIKAMIQKLSSK